MENTKIEWAHHTFNPWWGCQKVSDGCKNCYAETLDKRMKGGEHWGPGSSRMMMSDKYWEQPYKWDAAAKSRMVKERVFCASMADVFEDNARVFNQRYRLFALIEDTPNLIWLLLTKRPENIARLIPGSWSVELPSNVWFGTSVENQEQADIRIPALVSQFGDNLNHQNKLFLSMEPLLGPIDFKRVTVEIYGEEFYAISAIDWVIVGGESGPGARPMHPDWVRGIKKFCHFISIAFFFKQWGEFGPSSIKTDSGQSVSHNAIGYYMYKNGKKANGRKLDDKEWDEVPLITIF